MIHSDRATGSAPNRGGAKPPPVHHGSAHGAPPHAHPPAKDTHGPGAHGKDAPENDPHGKKGPPPRSGPRPVIHDDLPEEEAVAKAPSWSLRLPALKPPSWRTVRRTALVILALAVIAATAYGTVRMIRHNMELARRGQIQTALVGALEAHTQKHHGEGRSFEEISFTDYLRHCVGATASSVDYVIGHHLEGAGGPALLAEAEGGCLREKVMEIQATPTAGDLPTAEEAKAMDVRIHTFLIFAREHGYQFPPDLMAYERRPDATNGRPKGETR